MLHVLMYVRKWYEKLLIRGFVSDTWFCIGSGFFLNFGGYEKIADTWFCIGYVVLYLDLVFSWVGGWVKNCLYVVLYRKLFFPKFSKLYFNTNV